MSNINLTSKEKSAVYQANHAFIKNTKGGFCVACFTIEQFGNTSLEHDCLNPPKLKQGYNHYKKDPNVY